MGTGGTSLQRHRESWSAEYSMMLAERSLMADQDHRIHSNPRDVDLPVPCVGQETMISPPSRSATRPRTQRPPPASNK